MASSIRKVSQKNLGADFQFHVKRQYFQVGAMMSGNQFRSNNNIQGHVGYGLRKETEKTNFAAYLGPSYFTGVDGDTVTGPRFYSGFGGYICLQAVTKLSYDIGFGAELFAEVNYKQVMAGFKIVAFFSGAYRGNKKNFNPNVRSQYSK